MQEIKVEPLDDHPRGAFSCGLKKIDNFFQNNALKSHRAYAQRVFVACKADDKAPLGFYALTTMTFRPGMNDEADKKFGRFDAIPTVYLTMIGRSLKAPKGLGEFLMIDAFKRALLVREQVGVYALTLHAFNPKVQEIYKTFGFETFANSSQDMDEYKAMFIPLSTVAAAFEAAEH
jgi:hypothetical protein